MISSDDEGHLHIRMYAWHASYMHTSSTSVKIHVNTDWPPIGDGCWIAGSVALSHGSHMAMPNREGPCFGGQARWSHLASPGRRSLRVTMWSLSGRLCGGPLKPGRAGHKAGPLVHSWLDAGGDFGGRTCHPRGIQQKPQAYLPVI